jgi:hypothetical protein
MTFEKGIELLLIYMRWNTHICSNYSDNNIVPLLVLNNFHVILCCVVVLCCSFLNDLAYIEYNSIN